MSVAGKPFNKIPSICIDMPCPFSDGSDPIRAFERRGFLERALAVGGAAALSACLGKEGKSISTGPSEETMMPDRQHAWNEFLPRDAHGNTVLPHHQLILFLDYAGEGTPTTTERERVESTLRAVERAYQRGNGGENPYGKDGQHVDGVLFTIGYSKVYFDRYDEQLPDELDFPSSESTLRELGESPDKADKYDAALVLQSDRASVLLAVEHAVTGRRDRLNGLDVSDSFDGVFRVAERRTGFIGTGLPAKELDIDEIPERSPLAMGFKSNVKDTQPTESQVTIESGAFAGGTTQHISKLRFELEEWYSGTERERVERMFGPGFDSEELGEIGEALGGGSDITPEAADRLEHDSTFEGRVGHLQKLIAARTEDFEPRILRRSEGVSTTDGQPGLNFTSIQTGIGEFVRTRKAMNGANLPDVDEREDGILGHIEVIRRGNYLIPPREHRSLPTPLPGT